MNSWLPRISKAMRVTVKRAMVALRCLISFHHHQSHKNPMELGHVLWFPTATMRSFRFVEFALQTLVVSFPISDFHGLLNHQSMFSIANSVWSFLIPKNPSHQQWKSHLFLLKAPIYLLENGEFSFQRSLKWPSGFLRWRRGLHGNSPWDSGAHFVTWRRASSLYI